MAKRAAKAHKPLVREPLRKRIEKMMLCIKFIAGCGAHWLPHQWTGAGYILVYKFLLFLHHLSSFFQAANAGTINMQKPFRKEEQCWSNPQIEGLDRAQKAECRSAALRETAQGMGSGPRACWRHRVSLGHGGSDIPAVVVCMVRGFVFLFALVLEKSEQNPSQPQTPCWKCSQTLPTTLLTELQWHRERLHRAGTHLARDSQRSAAPCPSRGAEQHLRLTWEDSWGFLSALAKLRPLCHQPLRMLWGGSADVAA